MSESGPGRLTAAGAVACAGALTCFGAVRAVWVSGAGSTLILPVTGSRPARLPVAGRVLSGSEAGAAPALAASLIVCVLIVWGVLAGSRSRRGIFAGATALAGVCLGVVGTAAATAARRATEAGIPSPDVRLSPVILALTGAFVAVLGAAATLYASRTAMPVRMPEGAPEMPMGESDA